MCDLVSSAPLLPSLCRRLVASFTTRENIGIRVVFAESLCVVSCRSCCGEGDSSIVLSVHGSSDKSIDTTKV